jgi:hypothetical protein
MGWSETTATDALVQDEAVQAVLGMNQKHILLPCPGIFQPPSLPQNFPLLPTPPPPTYSSPSYLLPSLLPTSTLLPPSPHFLLTSSPKLRRAHELE